VSHRLLFIFFFSSPSTTHDFTMNASDPADLAEIAKSKAASHDIAISEKNPNVDELTIDSAPQQGTYIDDGIDKASPTADELANLRRIAGKIPWAAYTIAFVELCERFSYYGTTAVCKIALF
jgi:POT family proton-dependent oligopeptide transporter